MRRFSGSDRPTWRDRARIAFHRNMTLYVYRCPAANEDLQAFFPLGQAPDSVTCPDHGAPARRLPSRGTFAQVPGGHDQTYKR